MEYFLHGDIETGGLDGKLDDDNFGMLHYPIFELAFILTDTDLNQVGEPLRIVVHQSEEDIAKSHEWAINQHTESGLLAEVRESNISLDDATTLVLTWLKDNGVEPYNRKLKNGAVFSGNSIKLDRNFIEAQMKPLSDYLHYRQLDISVLALAARAFMPELEKEITSQKEYKHEALADIKESIAELKAYRAALFSSKPE